MDLFDIDIPSARTQSQGMNKLNSVQASAEATQSTTIQSPDSLSRTNSSILLRLDTLPLEIIQRIATQGSCKAVLALRRVCRALHHACSDVIIMKCIIDQSYIRSSASAQSSRPAWYDGTLSLETPFSSWARYALAHEQFEQLLITDLEFKHGEGHLTERQIASWMPQLLASHYPLHKEHQNMLQWYLFDELTEDPHVGPKVSQAIWFCLAASEQASRSSVPKSHQCQAALMPLANSFQFAIEFQNRLFRLWTAYDNRTAEDHAQLIVPFFQSVLKELGALESYPTSDVIPFSTFMTIPLPFSEFSIRDFASCHLITMTSRDFLVGDEWMGYYKDVENINGLDPPMRGVIFESYKQSVIPELRILRGRGTDFRGEFTLLGEMGIDDGKLIMGKRYINGDSWQYSGVMTPFGIVGKWYGRSSTDVAGGLFWLWKAKWTRGSS